MTAVAVPTIAYSGTCGSRSSTSTVPVLAWLPAAPLSAEATRSNQGVATAAIGTIASMPTIATPSSPPAVRAAASLSPESIWPTSAGTRSDENIAPASRP